VALVTITDETGTSANKWTLGTPALRCTIDASGLTAPRTVTIPDTASTTVSTGAQTWTGVKTFGSSPIAPTPAAGDRSTTVPTTAWVYQLFDTVNYKPAAYGATTTTLPTYVYANGVAGVGATITFTANGPLTTDGVTYSVVGQNVLVKNETGGNAPYNGLYSVQTVGVALVSPTVLVRNLEMGTPGEFTNALVSILNGTTLGGQTWQQTATITTIGSDNVTFAVYSGAPVTLTLTGDVTGSGTGSFATTITNSAVTLAKMANMATASFLGRNTAGTGAPEVLSPNTVKSILAIANTDVSGLGTASTLPFDTDGTLAANDDAHVPTDKAVRTYVTANAGGVSLGKIYAMASGLAYS
jgi:hypothetical protein